MIKSQCECCKKLNTSECNQVINFDGTSCPSYIKKIDLTKKKEDKSESFDENIENGSNNNTVQYTPELLKQTTEIHGWLVFFLFAMTLGGIISAIFPIVTLDIAEYAGSWSLAFSDIILGLMLLGVAIYADIAFCKRLPNAVFIAKIYVLLIFITNVLFLIGGDFENTGLNTASQALKGVIWGVVWFLYLCFSDQVKTIIPKEYRKVTSKDYILLASIVIIPIFFIAIALGGFQKDIVAGEKAMIESSLLEYNEHTDGRIIFKKPSHFTCSRQDSDGLIFHTLENDYGSITIVSEYNTDDSKKNFIDYWNTFKDEDTEEWNSNIIKDDQININGSTGWYRTVKFTRDEYNDVYWEFIMIVDQKTEKTCVISSWTSDYDENTLSRLMNSIRFSL
jgi:hypothetical protein